MMRCASSIGRRAVLAETVRRTVQEIEDVEVKMQLKPPKQKRLLDERVQDQSQSGQRARRYRPKDLGGSRSHVGPGSN